ncbi:APC family permease [Fonticella tunisiensis]|uniref:Amino acid/polyamine/organocation transporter (APC superfamily) n=1 Tax=Fonticella tunisiensis TaxID=1096341 RepID=A0A4R7KSC3_9CLOT|nr:APC family permease [Fonticella tunisiensis]TDT62410.1 amino acid/polyamine/organocation transporter (APC superfamily) [Fonticella tunisiensis]
MIKKLFDILIGKPLPNEQTSSEKYNIPFGLAVMASDAISSVAYAAEEILIVLIGTIGLMSYTWLGWISLAIIGLLFILTISYIQIIKAYPHGGGAYIVAKENIGIRSGLIAAASLLIDYILTVAVSASAGVAAIISAFPNLSQYKVELVVGLIIILTILNLRGISESSRIFSVPTYLFIISMIIMIIYGMIKYTIYGAPAPMINEQIKATGELSLFLILRAFSSGCSALTGLEAVSNSVPNFKEPSQKNAKIVMILLSSLILFIFGGTSLLARFYHAIPVGYPTVVAQIAYGVFGRTFMFYVVQFTTAIILIMACNTAFTGFPMLMYVIARDGFAPRQFTIKGKRLSLSVGIVVLALVACLLVVIFNATTHRLIPLYSVGVFLSFTLAQIGMVINWRKSREKGWKKRVTINGIGAGITILTTLIIVFEKFSEGAWIVTVLIPVIVLSMISIKKHYDVVADMLRISKEDLAKINLNSKVNHIMIVPIASLNKAAINALQYARSITDNVIAINISTDLQALDKLKSRWSELNTDIALVAKYSPYRAILTPLLKYINDIANAAGEGNRITVVLPEFITHKWWGQLLHNHTSFFIRETLLRNENVVVSTYPYHLKDDEI